MTGDRERARIVAAVQVLKMSVQELETALSRQASSGTVDLLARSAKVDAEHVLALAKVENEAK